MVRQGKIISKKKSLSAAICVLVYMLISVTGMSGSVLCFGNDGHVAVEFVQNCNNANSRAASVEPASSDNCGPCKDVAFQSSIGFLQNTTRHSPVVFIFIFVTIAFTLSCNKYVKQFLARRFLPPRNSISSLKTVILLI